MPDDRPDERPHDILAAEEFTVPAADPSLHSDPAHDVLAADEFSVPARDPTLQHGPVTVPEPPFGAGEPAHDVLAAEEFAVPAGRADVASRIAAPTARRGRRLAMLAGAAAAVTVLLRRRH